MKPCPYPTNSSWLDNMANEGFSKNELRFIEEPPRQIEIECPICLQVMLDNPHLVSCCGHHFCGTCIERVKISNKPCPICTEKKFQIFPDKGRLRIINGSRVYCINKNCQWNGELKSLLAHLNKGKREGECQFEEVECGQCQMKKQRKYIESHERNECSQRILLCPYCKCEGTHEWITQHFSLCPQYPIPCPNKCQRDRKFPRNKIDVHMSTKCPLQPVECEFKWAGCHYNSLRKDLTQHNIDSQLNHMSLIAKACGELKKECQELKSENEVIKKDNNNMKQKLEGVHHAIVGSEYPILPVMVDLNSETHFYTETCGRHMSFIKDSDTLVFRVHKGKFDQPKQPPVTKIVYEYNNKYHTVSKDNCYYYADSSDQDSLYSQVFIFIPDYYHIKDITIVIVK